MSERQHVDSVVGRHIAVQRDVAGIAEADQKFAEPRLLDNRPTDFRAYFKNLHLLFDHGCGTSRHTAVFVSEKQATTLQAQRCFVGNDYLWHSGIFVSASVPQLSSHAETSSPVKCSPVA